MVTADPYPAPALILASARWITASVFRFGFWFTEHIATTTKIIVTIYDEGRCQRYWIWEIFSVLSVCAPERYPLARAAWCSTAACAATNCAICCSGRSCPSSHEGGRRRCRIPHCLMIRAVNAPQPRRRPLLGWKVSHLRHYAIWALTHIK